MNKKERDTINKAKSKLTKELEQYRKEMFARKPEEIYKLAMNTLFMEATYQYTNTLLDTEQALASKILKKNASFTDSAKHVMLQGTQQHGIIHRGAASVKAKGMEQGSFGSLTVEDFMNTIIEYYNLDHDELKRKQEEAAKKEAERKAEFEARQQEAKVQREKRQQEEAEAKAKKKAETERKKAERQQGVMNNQVSLFGGVM